MTLKLSKLRVVQIYPFFAYRQHGQYCLGVGYAEDEPGGCASTDINCALLSVGPPTPPASALYRKRQTLSLVPSRMCLCPRSH